MDQETDSVEGQQLGPAPLIPTKYKRKHILKGHHHAVSCAKFSPCGHSIASVSADRSIMIWNVETGECKGVITGHTSGISDCAWSCDSRYVCTASDDATVRIWSVEELCLARTLRGHSNAVFCVAYNPQSSLVASGAFDETVKMWDVRTGGCLRTLSAHSDPVTSVEFNHDGSLLVSCGYDGLFRVWDAFTGQCLRTLVDTEDMPVGLARFTPNGRYLLTATLDSTVRLWNFTSTPHKCMKTYVGHLNTKHCLTGGFCLTHKNEDGDAISQYLVMGSEDSIIYLWEMQSKQIVQQLEGHTDTVLGVDCHPTRPLIVSCGSEKDRSVQIWEHT